MLVMVLNLPEQCSFQDLVFHLLFIIPKFAENSASRMDISLTVPFFFIDVAGATMSLPVVDLGTSLRPQQAILSFFCRSGLNVFVAVAFNWKNNTPNVRISQKIMTRILRRL